MLSVQNISRSFGAHRAVDDVSFDVGRGRLTGFVGGNGAGKTTTMRMILGVLRPDSGEVTLDGAPVGQAALHGFGYMPEERGLYPKMEIGEQLAYLARLHGIDKATAVQRADDLLERLGLIERRRDKLEALSLGNQQRVQVAAALVHDPDVLIMDEPFSGLDPLAVDDVVTVIAEHAARGIPVLFSSHQLDVVERLCDDLVIIAGGQVKAAGEREALREQYSGDRWSLETDGDAGWVRGVPGVEVAELAGTSVLFHADRAAADAVLRAAVERGTVASFRPVRPTLGEIFRDIVVSAPAGAEKKTEAVR
ncbi:MULTISPECIES: ABC transporter ATP-binding protein [Rathayibacter]|uniref:ABC transporter ATP-binding protein n=2 Tax=Rathayibacter festucae TaxID=110937 RepID=A0A3T0SZ93_9MICO|nr:MULTISPECIES: ATP-binding cassette domain-containing protein [Rathayibacter]AZZ51628.1 ABC transporter ATP-binding protein [Rathayibacter festucae DSM 15932]MCJ1687609.1 ATP-binding cassette domain-containing protein [Rathayibacter sp. VKM Ac-2927]QHC62991.1 ATP-binding cassette domain-containing protein [Rathayibacter festucae]